MLWRFSLIRHLRKLVFSIAVAILIEVMYFNYTAIKQRLLGVETVIYAMDTMNFTNWTQADGGKKISQLDPMIYILDLCSEVETLTIRADVEPLPDMYTIYYTTTQDEAFSAEKMLSLTPVTGEDTVALNSFVYALRVDPGEAEGATLLDISFTLNEASWDISFARIFAMLSIYWGALFLMRLQQMPDYGLDKAAVAKRSGEEEKT